MADAISTKNVWPYYSATNKSTTGAGGNTLGKDEFLKILITQLQNQDPAQPMQDRDFIAQMAQFSSLEQMMNVGSELKMLRQSLGIASGLIGQQATWMTYDEAGEPAGERSGVVEAIVMRSGEQYAVVDGQEVSLDAITKLEPAPEETES